MLKSILGLVTPHVPREVSPLALKAAFEAVTWCLDEQLASKSLRSAALDPSAILEMPDFSHSSESIGAWIDQKRDCYRRAVAWINERRSGLLKAAGKETPRSGDFLAKGKFLIYEPEETVEDGAAEAASKGFYDMKDAPPWDTWFLLGNKAIYCYVPEFFISRAQDGIDANPVDCMRWTDWQGVARVE